jgi:hypothetical protein
MKTHLFVVKKIFTQEDYSCGCHGFGSMCFIKCKEAKPLFCMHLSCIYQKLEVMYLIRSVQGCTEKLFVAEVWHY